MKMTKSYQISLLVGICIGINCLGKYIAASYELPLWMDCFGTMVSAYLLGPICGGIVGMGTNILYNVNNPGLAVYGLVNMGIGVSFGLFARRKCLENVSKITYVIMMITVYAVVVSSGLNFVLKHGTIGNVWGDGVAAYFSERGLPWILCSVVGELYMDFADKLLSIVGFCILLRLYRRFRRRWAQVSMLFVCVVACFGLFSTKVQAAPEEPERDYSIYTQTVFGKESGISSGEVNDIVQTDYGVMWIGTYAGLYRYNGSNFQLMSDFESVKNVNCLYVDEEGRIWIGTNDRGVSICINENISNVFDSTQGLVDDSVRSIVQGSDGLYYIGTTDGMSVVSLVGGMSLEKTIDEIKYAHKLCADENGNVVAITSYGEMYLLREGNIVATCANLKNGMDYLSAMFASDGYLYVGTTGNVIYVYDIREGQFSLVDTLATQEQQKINSITEVENGERFVCCSNGMGFFDENNRYHPLVINKFNTAIEKMLMDYQGNLWFASSRGGLLRLCESPFVNLYETHGMDHEVVNSSTCWRGWLYIGTDEGLTILDEKRGSVIHNDLTEAYQGIRIRCVYTDSQNRLWICAYGKGLVCIGPNMEQCVYDSQNCGIDNMNRFVYELSDGRILAANQMGAVIVQDGKVRQIISKAQGLTNTVILSVLEKKDGELYIGTDGDGIAVVKNGRVEKAINRESGLSSNIILRMVEDPVGHGIFVITSNGINYIEAGGEVRQLDQFPYYNSYDLNIGNGDEVFVLGSAGIYVVNREDLVENIPDMHYVLLDTKSGLDSALTANAWNYVSDKGDVYLSCETGMYKINFDYSNHTRRTYRMRVSQIKADGSPIYVQRGKLYGIDRDVRQIDFYPEIVNYSLQNPKVYYYLEGYDKQPIYLTQKELTTISYTNLPPGTYTFHLAIVNEADEVLEECSYVISKEKRIYDYRWFLVYLFLGAAILLICVTWLIVFHSMNKKLAIRNKELDLAKKQVEMGNETILAIARTVDARDSNTSEHSIRVSEYAVKIARKLGFREEQCEGLRKMALLHDIGKIGIPDSVLNKPGRLTDEEYEIMKSHVTRGAEILKDFTLVEDVVIGARHHHERYDGKGYPDGLRGEEIPLLARIIGVADAFDAMTVHRVYRNRLSEEHVLNEIKNGRGTQFDPQCVDILLALIRDKEIDMEALYQDDTDTSEEGTL